MDRNSIGGFRWTFYASGVMLLITLLVLVVNTFSFFADEGQAENFLYAKELKVDLVDIYQGDTFSLPGDGLDKDVYLTNIGEVEAVIRVQLTPTWEPDQDSLGNTRNPEVIGIILGTPTENWTYLDGWYYYNQILEPGENTTLLIDALKLLVFSNDEHEADYSDATYKLTIFSEAIQANVTYTLEEWNVNYEVLNNVDETLIWTLEGSGTP